jgi:hypothetical protein
MLWKLLRGVIEDKHEWNFYYVTGKNIPRSVALSYNGALNYANYYNELYPQSKPKIHKTTREESRERFMKRYHNTASWRRKVKELGLWV